MATSLRKYADAATIGETTKNSLIDSSLIYVGRKFESGTLIVAWNRTFASELSIIRDICPTRQLIQCILRRNRLLENKLLGAANFCDGGTE